MHHISYPNESAAYRAARNALLDDEIALRRQIEAVAAKRRALPPGGEIPEDYELAGSMVKNICYGNVKNYLGLEVAE